MNYLNVQCYLFLCRHNLIISSEGLIVRLIKLAIDDTILLFLREIIHKRKLYKFKNINEDYSLIINVDETPLCKNLHLDSIITNKGKKDISIEAYEKEKMKFSIVLAIAGKWKQIKTSYNL